MHRLKQSHWAHRLGWMGLASMLSLSVLAAPVLASTATDALEGGLSLTVDATPMPLPRFYARHVEEGNKLLAQNRITEAIDEFFTAKNINPDYYPTYVGMGDAYQRMGQLETAVDNYQFALRLLNPSYASDRLLRGNYYAQNRAHRRALTEYAEIMKIDPAAGNQYTLAMKNLRFGEDKKAVKAFEEAIKLDDDYPDPHFQLGNLYYRDNKMKKAVPEFEAAAKLETRNPLYHFALATAYYKDATSKKEPDLKVVEQAKKEYEKAQQLGMGNLRLHHNLGTCYLLTKNYDAAINELRQAVSTENQNPDSLYALGNSLYRKAMTINYTWDGAFSLTDSYQRQQNDTKFAYLLQAVRFYKLASRLNEKDPQVRYDMGVAYYRLSELKLTETFIDDMLRDKDSRKFYMDKGVKFFEEDMLQHAHQNFNEFLGLSSDNKMKENASKINEGLQKRLKEMGAKVPGGGGGHG